MTGHPTEAPCCRHALREATQRWPMRDKASDGVLSSDLHRLQSPKSDHDWGNAFDLTHDPAGGVDCEGLARELVRRAVVGLEPRLKYVIWNRQIASAKFGWRWRPYAGANPHVKHMHCSILSGTRGDTRPWWAWLDQSSLVADERPPFPSEEEDMPSLEELEPLLRRVVREEVDEAVGLVIRGGDTHPNHLTAVYAAVKRVEALVKGLLPKNPDTGSM